MPIMLNDINLVAEEVKDLYISLWLISLSTVGAHGDHSAWTSALPSILELYLLYL